MTAWLLMPARFCAARNRSPAPPCSLPKRLSTPCRQADRPPSTVRPPICEFRFAICSLLLAPCPLTSAVLSLMFSVGLFATEHELNRVVARPGCKLREGNRRAVMKMNHIK